MLEIIERLRRAKRAAVCFDRRIDLPKRPLRSSWTAEGSPLFDCSEPMQLRIRPQAAEPLLSVTLYTPPESHGLFDANMYLSSGTNVLAEAINCRPTWKRFAIPLHSLSGPGAERTKRGLSLELMFAGPNASELQLGELKLEENRQWQLKTNVQGVSFPRSGHHMLVDVLSSYFGSTFQYCGYYLLCDERPCAARVNHLQKNHDHELTLPSDSDCDYLVQYRHPLHSITSHYEHKLRHGQIRPELDCRETWEEFAMASAGHWRLWAQKWLIGNTNPRAFELAYEEIMADAPGVLSRLVRFFGPSHPVDLARLHAIIKRFSLAPRRSLESFRYFDADFFRKLESLMAAEVQAMPSVLARHAS